MEDDTPPTEQDDTPPTPGMLKLISSDGFSFIIKEEYASVSSVIRAMMKSGFTESRTKVVYLPEIRGCVLEMICQYFYYVPRFHQQLRMTLRKKNRTEASSMPPFDSFMESFGLSPMQAVELMWGAQYLDL